MNGCAAVIYKLSIWPEYFSALHWPLLCTRCTNSILLSAPAAQKFWHRSSKSKAGLLNSHTEKIAQCVHCNSTNSKIKFNCWKLGALYGCSEVLTRSQSMPENTMNVAKQQLHASPSLTCHIIVPRLNNFLNHCLCARPACVAKTGPLVQVLKKSGSQTLMLRIKTLSVRDSYWRN